MNKKAIANVKTRLEASIENGNPHWNITPEAAAYITELLKEQQPARTLEIGTSIGYSAICIGEALAAWDGELITIESNNARFEEAQKNIAETELINITQVLGHAPEILDEIDGTFGFVFFDATKYEHLSYFHALEDRINAGGMIIADNMLSHSEELSQYKEYVETQQGFESELVEVGTGLLVSRKAI